MKPPTRESKKVEPIKFVRVLAELGRSKCITPKKYRTKLTMFATKPMLSNADNTGGTMNKIVKKKIST